MYVCMHVCLSVCLIVCLYVTAIHKNSAALQVRRALHEAKAKLKELTRPTHTPGHPPGLAPGSAPTQFAVSSAASAAPRFTQPPVSLPAGREQAPGVTTRQTLLDLASEARLHPFGAGHPPPPPRPRVVQPPPPPPPRVPPSAPGVLPQASVHAYAQPRPYLQPYQPPPGGIRPGGAQGSQAPYRQPPLPQQAINQPQEQYRQPPYPGGLEPYRPVAGGRGLGPTAGRGPAMRPAYTGPGQGSVSGTVQHHHHQGSVGFPQIRC